MVLVAAGAVLVSAGPGPLLDLARWVLDRAAVLMIAAAVGTALWLAVPRESRGLPLVLAGAGVLVWLLQHGAGGSAITGGALIGLGAVLATMRDAGTALRRSAFPGSFKDDVDPVHTYWRVGGGPAIRATADDELPRVLRLRAIGTPLVRVDLTAADPVQYDWLEIALTCWLAEVELSVPPTWAVVAGRVAATRRVRFVGSLDSTTLFTDVGKQHGTLSAVAAQRDEKRPFAVVVHVAGAVGTVRLAGR